MKVVAVNGSAREGGNTRIMLDHVCAALEKGGIETRIFELAGKAIHGCRVCETCSGADPECTQYDDDINEVLPELLQADGIILGSPVYFSDVTPEMKALIDRAGRVNRTGGHKLLTRKVASAVAAVRRAGAIRTLDTMTHFFTVNDMVVVGSSYWNVGIAHDKGDMFEDAEGLRTMTRLGENMAWVMKKLAAD